MNINTVIFSTKTNKHGGNNAGACNSEPICDTSFPPKH